MTKSMVMNRAALVHLINKGLRIWLFNAGAKVQQTDFSIVPEGRETAKELMHILQSLEKISFLEDQYFLPALTLHTPFIVSSVQAEKLVVKELSGRLYKCLKNYLLPGSDMYYSKTGNCIQDLYMELVSYLLLHMNRQESLFNGLRSQIYESGLNNQMAVSEEHGKEFSFWILKGMNSREISEWLESGSKDALDWKIKIWGILSPDRLSADGIDLKCRAKSGLAAA
jgi:hypothetical protein